MDIVLREYEKKLEKALNLASEYLHEKYVQDDLRNLLELTERNLTNKWKTGKKVVRTKFALDVFPDYPIEFIGVSLYADAIVNLLDDILDELMSKKERSLYVIEIIKILTILFDDENLSKDILKLYSKYFSKILCVAVSEMHYSRKMLESNNVEDMIQYAIRCYDYRAYDVDLFFEIPMFALYERIDENLLEMARAFRAINLIIKDYNDIEHDIKNETTTPLVIIYQKYPEFLEKCIKSILSHYKLKAKELIKTIEDSNSIQIAKNILDIIDREIEKIKY